MSTNFILPFAQGGGANVQSQVNYNADVQRALGNQPGTARSDFVNKALRQLSCIAVGVAQFMADNQGTDITDDLVASAISAMLKNAVKAAAQSPAGTVVWLPGTSPLANTLKVNGALLTRATYPNLYSYANASSGNMAASDGAWVSGQFSPGDGTTTFRIPDFRGYTFRAWDDGRGIDSGRTIGSVQLDQLLAHSHTISDPSHAHATSVGDGGHSHVYTKPDVPGGNQIQFNTSTIGAAAANTSTAFTGITVGIVGAFTGITGTNNSSGGAEVRVKSLALMPIIYY